MPKAKNSQEKNLYEDDFPMNSDLDEEGGGSGENRDRERVDMTDMQNYDPGIFYGGDEDDSSEDSDSSDNEESSDDSDVNELNYGRNIEGAPGYGVYRL